MSLKCLISSVKKCKIGAAFANKFVQILISHKNKILQMSNSSSFQVSECHLEGCNIEIASSHQYFFPYSVPFTVLATMMSCASIHSTMTPKSIRSQIQTRINCPRLFTMLQTINLLWQRKQAWSLNLTMTKTISP
jgi:hypothetical protein